ncbi:MAG: alkaline phosphatase family protein [bacterium]|nr:alkaline phosphatase family protein [bacterium]
MRVDGQRSRRALLIGVDGAMLSMVERYLEAGAMPALAGLLSGGTAMEALPSIPVDTPTNWTTIATGAEPVNHGINSFIAKWAGEEFTVQDTHRARSLQSTTSKAELLWETVGRHGGSSLVVNYPVGWPPKGDGVRVIGGDTPGGAIWHTTREELYAQGSLKESLLELHGVTITPTTLSFRPAESWAAAPGSDSCSAFLPVSGHEPAGFWAQRRIVGGHVRLALSRDESGEHQVADLAPGEWSEWLPMDLDGRESATRFRLIRAEVSGELELYRTRVEPVDGYTHPADLAADISSRHGPYVEGLECPYVPAGDERPFGPANINGEVMLELAGQQVRWMTDVICEQHEQQPFDLLMSHFHLIDYLNHTMLGYLDADYPYASPAYTRLAGSLYTQAYRLVDDLIAGIVRGCADSDTSVVVVSDHACLPCWRYVSVLDILRREGLVAYDWDSAAGRYVLDPANSLVGPALQPQHVWVNLAGREPSGTVEPRDYETVRQRVIDTLGSVVDPGTGERPFELVARREALNLSGAAEDRIGDVVYFLKPTYTTWDGSRDANLIGELTPERMSRDPIGLTHVVAGHHTPHLPAARRGEFHNSALALWFGAGLGAHGRPAAPMHLRDVAPTLGRLLGIPGPAQADGAVRYSLLGRN